MTTSLRLLNVEPKARGWRDLDPREQCNEKMLRISLVVTALVLLLGIIIAICCCATTTSIWRIEYNGIIKFAELTNAIILPVPIIVGGTFMITLLIIARKIDFERHPKTSWPDFKKESVQAMHFECLSRKPLRDLFAKYRLEQHGGLGPLVRNGFLTVGEGNKIRAWLAQYKILYEKMHEYEGVEDKARYAQYNQAFQKATKLEKCWRRFQRDLSIVGQQ